MITHALHRYHYHATFPLPFHYITTLIYRVTVVFTTFQPICLISLGISSDGTTVLPIRLHALRARSRGRIRKKEDDAQAEIDRGSAGSTTSFRSEEGQSCQHVLGIIRTLTYCLGFLNCFIFPILCWFGYDRATIFSVPCELLQISQKYGESKS